MNKTVRNLVERVIDEEAYALQDANFNDMTEEEKQEHDEVFNKISELEDKLQKILSKEQWEVFMEYSDTVGTLCVITEKYMFNRGVKKGFTKLSYIKEELGNLVIML